MLSRPSSLTSAVPALALKADFELKESRGYKHEFILRAKGQQRWLVLGQEAPDTVLVTALAVVHCCSGARHELAEGA